MNICEHLVNYFTEMCFSQLIFSQSEISIALRNGLAPIWRQAISQSNAEKGVNYMSDEISTGKILGTEICTGTILSTKISTGIILGPKNRQYFYR